MKVFVALALLAACVNAQILVQRSPVIAGIPYDVNEHPDLPTDYAYSSSDLNRDGIPDNKQVAYATPLVAAAAPPARVMTIASALPATLSAPLPFALHRTALPLIGRKKRQTITHIPYDIAEHPDLPGDYASASSDLNRDGTPDIYQAAYASPIVQAAIPAALPVAPLALQPARTVTHIPYDVNEHPDLPSDYAYSSSDLNRDGIPDIEQAAYASPVLEAVVPAAQPVLLGRKKRQTITHIPYDIAEHPDLPGDYASASSDLNRDGTPDILQAAYASPIVQAAIPAGLPVAPLALQPARTITHIPYDIAEHPDLPGDYASASSDLNRDGTPDILQAAYASPVLPVGVVPASLPLLGRKKRQTITHIPYDIAEHPDLPGDYASASSDLNRDGTPDIYQAAYASPIVQAAIPAVLPAAPLAVHPARTITHIPYDIAEHPDLPGDYASASSDLNRDGTPDIYQAAYASPSIVQAAIPAAPIALQPARTISIQQAVHPAPLATLGGLRTIRLL